MLMEVLKYASRSNMKDEFGLYPASEAKRRSTSLGAHERHQIERIAKKIKEASDDRMFNILIQEDEASYDVRKYLKEQGYEVECIEAESRYDSDEYRISW